ncbi:glycine--tRNA ligase 1 [Pyrus ussuriensis x Pyrus communis]|uniref:Glycine--tRNA ligase 1 n=1 Tax=Pyrus ussuriensis x Pyrus communis TaxID=2448454 RepID=A0A5N5F864_9ROSA|nr:glycine--tRNA ligase 1 [Pyrus ussuriensis x Pyrus communis]
MSASSSLESRAAGGTKPDIDAANEALNPMDEDLKVSRSVGALNVTRQVPSRQAMAKMLQERLFYIPSFKIYDGAAETAGLFDYGPPCVKLKNNVLAFWRQHFILGENTLEVECPFVTPEIILKASGHVDKFTDLMVKDKKNANCYGTDHLLKDFCKEKQSFFYKIAFHSVNKQLHGCKQIDPEEACHDWSCTERQIEEVKTIRLGEAVAKGIVDNQTLAYFIGRVYLFLTRLGIDEERLRFRQHLPNEMAHYAADCWDCVGIADRSAYDLQAHSVKSNKDLMAHEKFSEPREVEELVISPVVKETGLAFKANGKNVVEALKAMNEKEALDMKADSEANGEVKFNVCTLGENVSIKQNMVTISYKKRKEHQRRFTPSVIEPSFGIGRIIYCLFEHSYYTRQSQTGDEQSNNLNVLRFPPLVAPFKCTVFPLVQNKEYEEYARTDELGVPLAITVDSTTSVTIRERDSKDQVRVNLKEVVVVVKELTAGVKTWADVWRAQSQKAI